MSSFLRDVLRERFSVFKGNTPTNHYVRDTVPVANVWEVSGLFLLRNIGPVSGSGHQCLGINGSKSKVVADPQSSSVRSPRSGLSRSCQTFVSGRVDNQILYVPPSQIIAVCGHGEGEGISIRL